MVSFGAIKAKLKKRQFLSGPELLAKAEAEPRIVRPRDFLPAVDRLREKGFSWRRCSEWLKKHSGIEIHHTHLMRLSEDRGIVDPSDGPDS